MGSCEISNTFAAMMATDTIVALATAPATGAIGVVRLSGPQAISIADSLFKGKRLQEQDTHTVHFGYVVAPPAAAQQHNHASIIDEVVVTLFKNPKSYTGEDVVEISGHGSLYILNTIINLCIAQGARLAKAGEFTQRAFLNGKLDLTQAEAVADLIAAESKAAHEVAMNQMRGGVSSELAQLREALINFTALIELELDFSDEDVAFADRNQLTSLIQHLTISVQNLIHSFEYGNAIKNGVPVAIIGKPNAGKSTLLNALLREERAIVSEIAGTTRDTIEEVLNIAGIQFRFIDTAGIRATDDTIEAIGVARAIEKAKKARIILYLYNQADDAAEEVVSAVTEMYREGVTIILVHNKIDLNGGYTENALDNVLSQQLLGKSANAIVAIAAKQPDTIEPLKQLLVQEIKEGVDEHQQIITNVRHKEALEKALQALIEVAQGITLGISGDLLSLHLKDAIYHLGTITGKIDVDKDILGAIFGKFCIGK